MQRRGFNFKTRRIKRSLFKKIFPFFGIVLIGFGLYKIFATLFLVKTIKIAGEQGEVLKGIEKLGNQNLLLLNKEKWEKEIGKENPLLEEIEIKKNLPSEVVIEFKKRKPKAAIFDPRLQSFFLIDKEGVIVERKEEEERLPFIVAHLQNFKIGDRIKNRNINLVLALILSLEEDLEKAKFEIDEKKGILKVTLEKNILILIDLEKEVKETVFALQILMKKFKIEGKWPKKIDLRFEKPILVF